MNKITNSSPTLKRSMQISDLTTKQHFLNIDTQDKGLLSDESGLTLIDMALVLIALGLLLAPAIRTYQIWKLENDTHAHHD